MMASTRSSLLEGLEEISEEEQLQRLLEISKQDAESEFNSDPGPGRATNSFEEWASLPSDLRLEMVRNSQSGEAGRPDRKASDEAVVEDEDEELKKAIEVSKKEKFLTEEEKTNLAIQQSLRMNSPVAIHPAVQGGNRVDMGQLESAIRTSLNQCYKKIPPPAPVHQSPSPESLRSLRSPSPPAPPPFPVTDNNPRLSQEAEALTPLVASALPSLTFEEQIEEAKRQSARDPWQLSYDDQIRMALELSQNSQTSQSSQNLVNPGSSHSSAHGQLGAIPRSKPVQPRPKLRTIVIDGSNVCWQKKDIFIIERLEIAYKWFLDRGHNKNQIVIILPLSRHKRSSPEERRILDRLADEDILTYTPHRRTGDRSWNCYDDVFIVKYASQVKGIVVTNDNYRDIINESEEFREQIENRLLPFSWIKDTFMPAEDPLGKDGPRLSEFLKF